MLTLKQLAQKQRQERAALAVRHKKQRERLRESIKKAKKRLAEAKRKRKGVRTKVVKKLVVISPSANVVYTKPRKSAKSVGKTKGKKAKGRKESSAPKYPGAAAAQSLAIAKLGAKGLQLKGLRLYNWWRKNAA